jgi:hypothetical protein
LDVASTTADVKVSYFTICVEKHMIGARFQN